MSVPHWYVYRIEIPCPSCGKEDFQRLGELIGKDSVTCRVCGEPIDISDDKWQSAIKEIADGLSKIHILSSSR